VTNWAPADAVRQVGPDFASAGPTSKRAVGWTSTVLWCCSP